MTRLVGIDLPKNKRIEVGLTYIYGVGRSRSRQILEKTGINKDIKVKDLSEDEIVKLREALSKFPLEGDLKREITLNIKRLSEISCYRGVRHRKGLPVRGQRTKTNARTKRGVRRTVANKKKAETKG
jgi:small subunit ribosomal protein S13